MKTYTREEVQEATLEYFSGDDLATDAWITKHALKDSNGELLELTPDDMHRRLAREFARIEAKYVNGLTEDEIYKYLKDFKYIVPQGSPMYGIGNPRPVSLSNCTVIESPMDTMSSILDAGKEIANLSKRRCGVGVDLSELRPEGMRVNNSANTTSGAWSFAEFYSFVGRMVGQGGRRAALMITMDVRHPDIYKFVTMKSDLKSVTGANVSVKLTDDFMKAAEDDEEFTLHWPIGASEPEHEKTIKARDLFMLIVKMATENAEPGAVFWDTLTQHLPAHSYDGFQTISLNPCAEIALGPNGSCRLISNNLKNFVKNPFTKDAYFDEDAFAEAVRVSTRLADDLVDLELEKVSQIIDLADTEDEKEMWRKFYRAGEQGRRVGEGFHGLADCLAGLGLRYDSEEAIEMARRISHMQRDVAYRTSIELAKERGAFPAFDWELEKDNKYIRTLPQDIQDDIAEFGRRNISLLTCAPTGTVSLLSQTSSGIEPVFRNSYIRRRKLDHDSDITPDFVDALGDEWVEYEVFHPNVKQYIEEFGEDLPDYFVTSDEIDWEKRVEMQAALGSGIDHSISSTINLPRGTPVEVVANIYMTAWKKGLKGITVYVDGSRDGVLLTGKEGEKDEQPETLLDALKEGGFVKEDVVTTEKGVIKGGVKLGDALDNGPTEIIKREGGKFYIHMSYLPNDIEKKFPVALWIHSNLKEKREWVAMNRAIKAIKNLLEESGVCKELVEGVFTKSKADPHHVQLGRAIAMAMRHNIPLVDIVYSIENIEGDYVATTLTAVRKFLKKSIEDGTLVEGGGCQICGGQIIYEEGCDKCLDCGATGCS